MPEAKPDTTSYARPAIGVPWTIESARSITAETRLAIDDLIEGFDQFWSRFRTDSVVSRIAREPGSYPLPAHAGALLNFYRELYEVSGGKITPLVGRALEHWGYDREYSLSPQPGPPPGIPEWTSALEVTDGVLHAPRPVLVDIGAAGKGLLVDLVTQLMRDHGHSDCVVDASGDLRVLTGEGRIEHVGLENPHNPALAIGVAHVGNEALAGSATNRRRWAPGVHHVLDGLTGLPATGVSASWVIAPEAMVADGLATALLVVEPELIAARWDVPWVVMFDNGHVRHSDNFPGEIFA